MPDDWMAKLWDALNSEPGPGAVIGSLVGSFGSSLDALPSFAAVFLDEGADELRVMVRGSAQVRIVAAGGAVQLVTGLGVSTWVEKSVSSPAEVELIGEGDGSAALPLHAGVAAVGRILWRITAASETPSTIVESATAAAEPHPEEQEPSAPMQPTGETMAPQIDQTLAADPDAEEGEVAPDEASRAHPGEQEVDASTSTRGYEHLLFGETRAGVVEDAAVRSTADPAEPAVVDPLTAAEPAAPEEKPNTLAPVAPQPSAAEQAPRRMITGIPIAGAAPAAADAAPGAAQVQAGDHDGETVSSAQLAALLGQQADSIPTAASTPAGRPHPALIVSTGQRVVLDRSAVVGRRPRAVRATGEIPHLVTVESANHDVSRSHVELGIVAGDVVATDLGTTNGTWLLRTNSEPVRLQPHEAALLVAGDRLDLGDGVQLSFEGL
ncbi:FHA domain-containing protein [Microbacterium suwonense]